MPRCSSSSSLPDAAREFRFSSEAIGTWNPWEEKGANGEDPGCSSGALSILLHAGGGNESEVVEAEAGLKSPLSRVPRRDGKLPGMRAPPMGTILFPILPIIMVIVVCFASGVSPTCLASTATPTVRLIPVTITVNCSGQPSTHWSHSFETFYTKRARGQHQPHFGADWMTCSPDPDET